MFKFFFFFPFLLNGVLSFSKCSNLAFAGRVASAFSRAELTNELSSRRSAFKHGGSKSISMSHLGTLGLKKSDNDIAIAEKTEEDEEVCVVEEEELSETKKLLKQVKEAGTAGVISYALWELGFWTVSVPVCVFGFREVTGNWPDFTNQEDITKLGAEAFAFVNFARFAVPLRIGLALGTTPWIQKNVVDNFFGKKDEQICVESDE